MKRWLFLFWLRLWLPLRIAYIKAKYGLLIAGWRFVAARARLDILLVDRFWQAAADAVAAFTTNFTVAQLLNLAAITTALTAVFRAFPAGVGTTIISLMLLCIAVFAMALFETARRRAQPGRANSLRLSFRFHREGLNDSVLIALIYFAVWPAEWSVDARMGLLALLFHWSSIYMASCQYNLPPPQHVGATAGA